MSAGLHQKYPWLLIQRFDGEKDRNDNDVDFRQIPDVSGKETSLIIPLTSLSGNGIAHRVVVGCSSSIPSDFKSITINDSQARVATALQTLLHQNNGIVHVQLGFHYASVL